MSTPWPPLPDGFTALDVRTDMDQAPWSDLRDVEREHGMVERIGLLRNGTDGGRASVALVIRLDGGQVVVAETTWRLFRAAVEALMASPAAAEET